MKSIPLTKGQFALVSDEDYERLSAHKWYAHEERKYAHAPQKFYAARSVYSFPDGVKVKKRVWMHHEVCPRREGLEVDHIDRCGLNNQRENLRLVTRSQNRINRPAPPKALPVGVVFGRTPGTYYANCCGKHLGTFRSVDEALSVYSRERELAMIPVAVA